MTNDIIIQDLTDKLEIDKEFISVNSERMDSNPLLCNPRPPLLNPFLTMIYPHPPMAICICMYGLEVEGGVHHLQLLLNRIQYLCMHTMFIMSRSMF